MIDAQGMTFWATVAQVDAAMFIAYVIEAFAVVAEMIRVRERPSTWIIIGGIGQLLFVASSLISPLIVLARGAADNGTARGFSIFNMSVVLFTIIVVAFLRVVAGGLKRNEDASEA